MIVPAVHVSTCSHYEKADTQRSKSAVRYTGYVTGALSLISNMEAFLVPVWAKWQLNMELRQKTAVLVVFGWVPCGSLDWLERRACAKSIQYDGGWLRWTVLSSHAYGAMGLYLAGEPNGTGFVSLVGERQDSWVTLTEVP